CRATCSSSASSCGRPIDIWPGCESGRFTDRARDGSGLQPRRDDDQHRFSPPRCPSRLDWSPAPRTGLKSPAHGYPHPPPVGGRLEAGSTRQIAMVDITHLRASSLPLAFLCPASVRPPALRIVQSNNAADLGTAVHEALRSLAETGRVDWDALPARAERHGANTDEMRALWPVGCRPRNSVSDSFQGAITEQELKAEVAPGVTLTGHGDIMAISVTSMRVGDWKTGRKDADHSHQLRAYAALALLSSQGIEEATGTALWLRDGEIENYTLTRADADA